MEKSAFKPRQKSVRRVTVTPSRGRHAPRGFAVQRTRPDKRLTRLHVLQKWCESEGRFSMKTMIPWPCWLYVSLDADDALRIESTCPKFELCLRGTEQSSGAVRVHIQLYLAQDLKLNSDLHHRHQGRSKLARPGGGSGVGQCRLGASGNSPTRCRHVASSRGFVPVLKSENVAPLCIPHPPRSIEAVSMEAPKGQQEKLSPPPPPLTSCRKNKKDDAPAFLADLKDHIDEFINASMKEHKTCFKKTMQMVVPSVVVERSSAAQEVESSLPLRTTVAE
ncbi:hypothetical protein NL676_015522 [Syzygium grande]|nr:hypothetical protein NL676_015522 [Syzygium grande]